MRKSYENTQIQEDLSDEDLCRLAAEGRREAEELLVTRYQRLVRTCARPFFLIGGDSEDLTQEGMVGLIKAVREYDAEKEASFRTFGGNLHSQPAVFRSPRRRARQALTAQSVGPFGYALP